MKNKIMTLHYRNTSQHKLDSPSAQQLQYQKLEKILNKNISISSERVNKEPGTHLVNYVSDFDKIEIKHSAFNRDGFALGAIIWRNGLKIKKVFLKCLTLFTN